MSKSPTDKPKKKNILIVLDNFRIGGISAINMHLFKIISALSKENNFYLLCGVTSPSKEQYLEYFSFCKKKYLYRRSTSKSHFSAFIETIVNSKKLTSDISKDQRIDYVLLNHPYSTIGVLFANRFKRSQIVCFFHGAAYLEKDLIYKFNNARSNTFGQLKWYISKNAFRILQKIMLMYAPKHICYSNYAKELLK